MQQVIKAIEGVYQRAHDNVKALYGLDFPDSL